jgi:hypothetical protein
MHGFVVTSLNNNTHAKVFWILDPCYQFQNYMTERLLAIVFHRYCLLLLDGFELYYKIRRVDDRVKVVS